MLKLKEKSIGLIEKVCGCSSIVFCPFCLVAVSILLLKPSTVKGTEFITIIINRYNNNNNNNNNNYIEMCSQNWST